MWVLFFEFSHKGHFWCFLSTLCPCKLKENNHMPPSKPTITSTKREPFAAWNKVENYRQNLCGVTVFEQTMFFNLIQRENVKT